MYIYIDDDEGEDEIDEDDISIDRRRDHGCSSPASEIGRVSGYSIGHTDKISG
jgi:hypothetical protein